MELFNKILEKLHGKVVILMAACLVLSCLSNSNQEREVLMCSSTLQEDISALNKTTTNILIELDFIYNQNYKLGLVNSICDHFHNSYITIQNQSLPRNLKDTTTPISQAIYELRIHHDFPEFYDRLFKMDNKLMVKDLNKSICEQQISNINKLNEILCRALEVETEYNPLRLKEGSEIFHPDYGEFRIHSVVDFRAIIVECRSSPKKLWTNNPRIKLLN